MARYAESQYAEDGYSGVTVDPEAIPFDKPWRVNGIRVEDILHDDGMPPVIPGQQVTYELYLDDNTPIGVETLSSRYEKLLRYIEQSPYVVTYETTRGVFYRNQSDHDQLVLIKPLASGSTGANPEDRDSPWPGRWAVVTGGDDTSRFPEGYATFSLETVTIAREDQFEDRDEVKRERERSGL